MKAFITPKPEEAPFGIKRVTEALYRYLPDFGVQIASTPEEADLINCHAVSFVDVPGKPLVHSNHGLHWGELEWPVEYLQVNQFIIDIMCRAQAITCPSDWVNHALRRGMLRHPVTIYHGVDVSEWQPQEKPGNYVLWNKARADVVSDPNDMNRVAELLPKIPFRSTLGERAHNVRLLGVLSHADMKRTMQQAGILLATPRETFGIGTLEALAAGVPVVGWDWGGQREIIKQGETGVLVPYGDYDALGDAISHVWEHRGVMGQNARQDALERWTWPIRIQQYADLFRRVLADWQKPRPDVSIILTCHNLGRYLADCLNSVKEQEGVTWECLIIDDASTDNTPEIAGAFAAEDSRFVYLKTPQNLKLSGARNYGIERSQGKYLMPLDADDMLLPGALATLARFLDSKPDLHLAYGGLDVMNDSGGDRRKNEWPADHDFHWQGQLAHINQMPYCTMMRREVAFLSGGYRHRDWRAEDAAFWCNVTSRGFRAGRATKQSVLLYRLRSDSKSSQEGHNDGDWTAWYPWRLGATNAQEGVDMLGKGKTSPVHLVPFSAQGDAPRGCWPVWSHHTPAHDVVSIIIPVGPGHDKYLIDALDSLVAQTFPFWEAVVVNDTGKPLDLTYAPFARLVENGKHDIASSRNLGIEAATGSLLLFLDADDILTPTAVQEMVDAYIEYEGSRYIYTDWYTVTPSGNVSAKQARDFVRDLRGLHAVSVLVAKEWCTAIGGFDSNLPGWEDWDFFVKLAINGYCGQRLKRPLLVYRTFAGNRREQSIRDAPDTLPMLKERYQDYLEGKKEMAQCCGGGGEALLEIKRSVGLLPKGTQPEERVVVMSQKTNEPLPVILEWLGKNEGSVTLHTISGKKLSKPYKFANSAHLRYQQAATSEDAALLVATGKCRYVNLSNQDSVMAQSMAVPVPTTPPMSDALVENIAQASTPVLEPEPEPEPVPVKEVDLRPIDEVKTTELLEYLEGRGVAELQNLLIDERNGKGRKTVLNRLQMAIEDAERI